MQRRLPRAVHDCRIVHRDIKPDNVLLREGRYLLADLGVAAFFDAGSADDTLTKTEGTPAFVPPECLAGGAFRGYPTDVWALGVTLHAMLTGRMPFSGGTTGEL
jgi:serine/threonine protein kinase